MFSLISFYICCDVFYFLLKVILLWAKETPVGECRPPTVTWIHPFDLLPSQCQPQSFLQLCPVDYWVQKTAAVITQGPGNELPRTPFRMPGSHVNQGPKHPAHALLSHQPLLTQHPLKDQIIKNFKMPTIRQNTLLSVGH